MRDYANVGSQLFEKALTELEESRKVRIEKRPNKRNRPVEFVRLEKNLTSVTSVTSVTSLCEISFSATPPKPKNAQSEVKYFSSEVTFSSEPRANDVAKPEPMPEPTNPEPPVPEPKPEPAAKSELSLSDLAEVVKHHLEQAYSRKQIHGRAIRQTLDAVCGEKANDVARLLYPKHLLRLGKTPYFILREDKHRPLGYEGLLDENGVLPDADPAPF